MKTITEPFGPRQRLEMRGTAVVDQAAAKGLRSSQER